MDDFKLLSAGDTALVAEFGDGIDQRLNAQVIALARRLAERKLDGVIETVPTFRSLMVHFDPLVLSADVLAACITALAGRPVPIDFAARSWRLPVCYDPSFAIDLDTVAEKLSLEPEQVVERHAGTAYHVYMLGFLPGQAYMGDLPGEIVLPRRETPRQRIPAGSVAIAMGMTCIFPMETPCGWHIVGRSPVPLFQAQPNPEALLAPGDRVVFSPVSLDEFQDIAARVAEGTYRPYCETPRAAA